MDWPVSSSHSTSTSKTALPTNTKKDGNSTKSSPTSSSLRYSHPTYSTSSSTQPSSHSLAVSSGLKSQPPSQISPLVTCSVLNQSPNKWYKHHSDHITINKYHLLTQYASLPPAWPHSCQPLDSSPLSIFRPPAKNNNCPQWSKSPKSTKKNTTTTISHK